MRIFSTLQIWFVQVQELIGWNKYEFVTLPVTNWNAVYKRDDDDGIDKRPLIAWEITYDGSAPVTSVGLVFIENRPPFVEDASSHPHFIGYERELTTFSDSGDSKLGHYESLNEWG